MLFVGTQAAKKWKCAKFQILGTVHLWWKYNYSDRQLSSSVSEHEDVLHLESGVGFFSFCRIQLFGYSSYGKKETLSFMQKVGITIVKVSVVLVEEE